MEISRAWSRINSIEMNGKFGEMANILQEKLHDKISKFKYRNIWNVKFLYNIYKEGETHRFKDLKINFKPNVSLISVQLTAAAPAPSKVGEAAAPAPSKVGEAAAPFPSKVRKKVSIFFCSKVWKN